VTPEDRLERQAKSWRVDVDEWCSGDVLDTFAGHGVVDA
jgi:hypothetical protein